MFFFFFGSSNTFSSSFLCFRTYCFFVLPLESSISSYWGWCSRFLTFFSIFLVLWSDFSTLNWLYIKFRGSKSLSSSSDYMKSKRVLVFLPKVFSWEVKLSCSFKTSSPLGILTPALWPSDLIWLKEFNISSSLSY